MFAEFAEAAGKRGRDHRQLAGNRPAFGLGPVAARQDPVGHLPRHAGAPVVLPHDLDHAPRLGRLGQLPVVHLHAENDDPRQIVVVPLVNPIRLDPGDADKIGFVAKRDLFHPGRPAFRAVVFGFGGPLDPVLVATAAEAGVHVRDDRYFAARFSQHPGLHIGKRVFAPWGMPVDRGRPAAGWFAEPVDGVARNVGPEVPLLVGNERFDHIAGEVLSGHFFSAFIGFRCWSVTMLTDQVTLGRVNSARA